MSDRKLVLTRPLVVFDLETTGLDPRRDRIVEISCVKLFPDGKRDVRTRRLNPEMPISPQATAVHGITDDDVKNEKTFAQVAKSLFEFLSDCDLSGFNVERFDLPLLVREFASVSIKFPPTPASVIDVWRIYMTKEPRDLSAAYRYYCHQDLANAHAAEADAVATADILSAQVARYDDLPDTVASLHEFCHPVHPDWLDPDGKVVWRDGEAVLAFGKHRDKSLRRMAGEEPEYLKWIAGSDFSDEVKRLAQAALRGEFPTPTAAGP
jgi:DNA polymerase-3 subunit epsilon